MNSLANIVKAGTADDKQQLIIAIMTDGLSSSAAYAYIAGTRRPKLLYQMNIQRHVRKIYGVIVPLDELFPKK